MVISSVVKSESMLQAPCYEFLNFFDMFEIGETNWSNN